MTDEHKLRARGKCLPFTRLHVTQPLVTERRRRQRCSEEAGKQPLPLLWTEVAEKFLNDVHEPWLMLSWFEHHGSARAQARSLVRTRARVNNECSSECNNKLLFLSLSLPPLHPRPSSFPSSLYTGISTVCPVWFAVTQEALHVPWEHGHNLTPGRPQSSEPVGPRPSARPCAKLTGERGAARTARRHAAGMASLGSLRPDASTLPVWPAGLREGSGRL